MNNIKLSPTTIVFDFDGTIADSLDLQIKLYNQLAEKEGYQQITKANLNFIRRKGIKAAVKEAGIPLRKLPSIINRLRKDFAHDFEQIPLVNNIDQVLINLKKKYHLGILTSNDSTTVQKYLKTKKIDNLFDFVYSALNIFGKDKVIKKMLKENKLSKTEVLYVGDEIRDIKACKETDLAIAAVSWGLNDEQALKKFHPDFLLQNPEQLLEIL